MGGGAWPFLVGGAICLVNSDNERDLAVLVAVICMHGDFEDQRVAGRGNNRSVMPLDVLGRTRATLTEAASGAVAPKGVA